MTGREREGKAPRRAGRYRRLVPRARNTLSSKQQPVFTLNVERTPPIIDETRLSGSFRVPSPTSSDEADIALQERELREDQPVPELNTLLSSLSTSERGFQSDPLDYLGDSSSLFSEKQESPGLFKSETRYSETTLFRFPSPSAGNMVVEREPPKPSPHKTTQPPFANVQQPQFGQPSPLQNRLQPRSSNVFNIPKPRQQRPEHHRSSVPDPGPHSRPISNSQLGYAQPRATSSVTQPGLANSGLLDSTRPINNDHRWAPSMIEAQRPQQPAFVHPFQQPAKQPIHAQQPTRQPIVAPAPTYDNADVVEIPKPANAPTWTTFRKPDPLFSAYGLGTGGFTSVNGFQKPIVDLTGSGEENVTSFDPPGLFDDQFGASDPQMYIDAGLATENIKALLEGAFDEDEDKPKTRGRKKKLEVKTDELVDRLKGLGVKADEDKENLDKAKAADNEEEEDEDDGTVEGLKVKLLPHQVEGVAWMKEKEIGTKKKNGVLPKGGILADDMGLGKTIQSISLILTNPRPPMTAISETAADKKALSPTVGRNTLVVAPLALIKQWEAEIKTKVEDSHNLKVLVHHGPQRTKSFQDLKKYDIVITTYQILVSEHGTSSPSADGPQTGCFGIHWYRVILDEAHTIKNRNAKSTKACYALRSEYRWCLTGTPMQNNLDELQSLIKFLRIKPYNDLAIWKDQITRPMSQGRGGVAMKRLQFYLKAFMKRRRKDILKKEGALNPGGKTAAKGGADNGFKITERRVESLFAEFDRHERVFYSRLEKRTDKSLEAMMDGAKMSYASALVLLLRLRQACNHPKLLSGSLSKDTDALFNGQGSPTKKAKAADRDIDDMADLLGGLSVQTKQCDVCQIDLTKDEVSSGLIRCSECEKDLESQSTKSIKGKVKGHKHHQSSRSAGTDLVSQSKVSRAQKRNVINDSDEEDGDWVIPKEQRLEVDLGRAGGSEDENVEGGGESIAGSDTDTGDESSIQVLGSRQRTIDNGDREGESNSQNDTESSEEHNEDASSASEESVTSSESMPFASAKIRHLLTILHRESATHKFIVYSQFTSMLDLIEPFLKTAKLNFTRYDGSMRNDLREASLEKLRHDPKCRILLCSLKCGSLGLNLTAASRVVILEPFWNPFVEEQAIDRVHRLNQTVDVVVYKLTIKDTVEARILELQEKKRALANAAIEGKADIGKLSMKDILNLFKRDAEHDIRHNESTGGDSKLGTLGSMLTGSIAAVAADLEAVSGLHSSSSRRQQNRVTPPVMERAKGAGGQQHRGEDAIYGRRW